MPTRAYFCAVLHPSKAAGKLTKAQCELLVSIIKQVLSSAIEQGGTTLKDFFTARRQTGLFRPTATGLW